MSEENQTKEKNEREKEELRTINIIHKVIKKIFFLTSNYGGITTTTTTESR